MNRVKELRIAAGMTQEYLARTAGLTLSGLRSVETGARRNPRLSTVQAIAAALNKPAEEIFPTESAPVPTKTG